MPIERSLSIEEFERCWPWMEASLAHMAFEHNGKIWPTHRREHLWERIATRRVMFWPGSNFAIITEFHTSPTGLKSHHTWLAGGELEGIVKAMPTIENWGRANDCQRQTGNGRRGWLRAFDGYHEVGVRKAKSLI